MNIINYIMSNKKQLLIMTSLISQLQHYSINYFTTISKNRKIDLYVFTKMEFPTKIRIYHGISIPLRQMLRIYYYKQD